MCALFFNFCGFLTYFFVKQQIIYAEVRAKMSDTSNHEKITLHKDDVQKYAWGRKELKIGEKLFDIVKQEAKGDSLVFDCVRDKKEEALYTTLEKFLDHKEQKKKNNATAQVNLVKFLLLVSILPQQNYVTNIEPRLISFKDSSLKLNSSGVTPDTPPPRRHISI